MKTADMPSLVLPAPGSPSSAPAQESFSDSRLARWDMVSGIKKRWADGEQADTRAVLEEHPDLTLDPSIVLDLAYVEFWARRKAGEKIEAEEFAERFPEHRAALERMLGINKFLEANPDVLNDAPRNWPNAGDEYLGFKLIKELGKGGFARAFLAEEGALGKRKVVVKISRHGGAEAETLGRIEHPNIVPIHSVRMDPATGLTVVCMPYLGPTTLKDVLEQAYSKTQTKVPRTPSPIVDSVKKSSPDVVVPDGVLTQGTFSEAVANIGLGMARGLAFMHERGIIHCDLKPANVLLDLTASPRILDFNLAHDSDRSTPGDVGGTPTFMAPEQLVAMPGGKEGLAQIDARADLFSLGVILFQLLSGEHPFGPFNDMREIDVHPYLLNRHRTQARPLAPFNPELDRALLRLVEKCLEIDPAQRPESAQAVATELERISVRMRQSRERVARMPRLVLNGILLAVAVTGLAGAGSVLAAHLLFPPQETPVQAAPSAEELKNLGDEALNNGKYSEAIGYYSEAIKAGLTSSDVYFFRAKAKFEIGCQHRDREIASLQKWKDPKHKEVEANSIPARTAFQDSISDLQLSDPEQRQWRAQAGIGLCYARMRQPLQAIPKLLQAEELGANSPKVFSELGQCYLVSGKNWELAERAFQKALLLEPANPLAFHGRTFIALQFKANEPDFDPVECRVMIESALRFGRELNAELYLDAAILYCLISKTVSKTDQRLEVFARAGLVESSLGSAMPCCHNLLFRCTDPVGLTRDQCLENAMANVINSVAKGMSLDSIGMDISLEPLMTFPPYHDYLASHIRLEGVEDPTIKSGE